MKALLGIVGQYRTFESTYSNILDNLISNNEGFDFDIIINTDDKNEDVIDYCNKAKKRYHYNKATLETKLNECYGKYLKHIIYYNVDAEDKKNGAFEIFKKRNRMILEYINNNDLTYDIYIFLRFDVIFTAKIDLCMYLTDQFTFICNVLGPDKREDHVRDWDLCWIASNKKYLDYYLNGNFGSEQNTVDSIDLDTLTDFSKRLNFKTGYVDDTIIKRDVYPHWVRGFWILFYNMHRNGCNVQFEEGVFCQIIR